MNLEEQTMRILQEQLLHLLENTKGTDADAIAVDIGTVNYAAYFHVQNAIAHELRTHPEYKDLFIFMEHRPTIDFGRKQENNKFLDPRLQDLDPYTSPRRVQTILSASGIDFTISTRPGGPAYLGPGQLIMHPIIRCERAGIKGVRDGQHKLDLLMRNIAMHLGVPDAVAKDPNDEHDKRDVYLPRESWPERSGRLGIKIGSKVAAFAGLDVMYNGFTFFLNREATDGFRFIPACGYLPEDLAVSSIQEICEARGTREGPFSLTYARNVALIAVADVLGYRNIPKIVNLSRTLPPLVGVA